MGAQELTDWPAIIVQIRRHGRMRTADIAAECDCGEGTLGDIVSGRTKEPRAGLGDKLRQLHDRVVPREAKHGDSEASAITSA